MVTDLMHKHLFMEDFDCMKKRILIGIKCILFVTLALFCVLVVNRWLMPKYYYNESWPTTNTYQDFYKLDKNTVEVLFFGSSHAVSSFNPQVIYDNYGIRSYNLGCEQQSLVITYYWLKEALKYQSPEAVVIDTYTFHKYKDAYVYNDMNCSEGAVRKPMDSMKLSPLKFEAGMAIEKVDPTQSGLSFPFTNIRYHTRWTSLGENDYTEAEMVDHGGIKGFSALGGTSPGAVDATFSEGDVDSVEAEPMVVIADEYLGKIVNLCEEEDIKLIFVNIPYGESIARYKSTKEYADAHNIPFYDFNEENLYHEIGYSAEADRYGHPNYIGAEKISNYLGELLLNEYGISTKSDSSFDKSREIYIHKVNNIKLSETTNIYEYLERLNDGDYDIFVFSGRNIGSFVDEDMANRWFALGFATDLRSIPEGNHYCAVKSDSIIEKMTSEDIAFSGTIRNGKMIYNFLIDTTNMLPNYQKFSMVINGTECGNQNTGIDIVIYDSEFKQIIDKVNINTTVEEKTMTRY